MTPILLIGGGGHCRSCIDVIETCKEFRIKGIIDNNLEIGHNLLGYTVLGNDTVLPQLIKETQHALITVGQIKNAATRAILCLKIEKNGGRLPTITSPNAFISRHATLGEGTIAMHGSIVNAGARVGRNVIINSQSLIEHDAQIGDHCHISTGAKINGNASIGESSFIGSGSIVHQGIKIGSQAVIGAGCIIRKDVPAQTILRISV